MTSPAESMESARLLPGVSAANAVLDIDGTFVDTNYQHALAWFRAFARHDIILPVWRIHRHIGMGGDQVVTALCGEEVEHATGDELRAAEGEEYGAVMVGDTPWDVRAAQRAGVPTLAVMTGGFAEQELRDAGAIAVFESVAQLRERLDATPWR